MRIGVIVAMQKELKLLLPLIENIETREKGRYTLYMGQLSGHELMVMQAGIGKVNAALCTQTLIDTFKPELFVNSGVAGGADASMHVLDLFVATGVAYHDVWCGPETEYGAAAGFDRILKADERVYKIADKILQSDKLKLGLICSGDKFISQEQEVAEIKSHFPEALAIDMESGAIAQVCVMNKTPFAVLRVISDTPGQEENISQYENFWADAPQETFEALRNILKEL
jgi:adenosylhomocysteine nucleosidase